jgi:hypothetical protein
MLDPVSIGLAISTASKAFEMIQKGFAVGRELEQMHGDMGRWMSATAEIAATAESAENAGVITRMLKGSGNIESIATQAVLAKKQIEQQRYELMVHIRMKYGMKTWDDILKAEGSLRKAKAKALEEQRKFMERSVLIVMLTTIIGWRLVWTLELGRLPQRYSMKIIQSGKYYILYDDNGKILIMSRDKKVCVNFFQDMEFK